ncbi:UNVERIFIED_CONTAM: hypothetical protein PYX00_000640 [Menopon gallinae]|uniref:MBD domain-containing protein n=1 Tax=Menopon gallinae TaxID=328185 RepID=A0AAW2IAX2_9NEOP
MMQSEPHCHTVTHNTGVGITKNISIAADRRRHSLNQIGRLADGHDVTVSNTMIKVTYNKGLKDHSVTSLSGNEPEFKRHSIGYKPSLANQYNCKIPQNHRKSFDAILLIPKLVSVTKANGTDVKSKINSKPLKSVITNENKLYNTVIKNKDSVINSNFNIDKSKLNHLRFSLVKLNTMDSKSASLNHMIEDHENRKIILKHNGTQIVSEHKNVNFGSSKTIMKKENISDSSSNNVQKERLKLEKDKDENFKKKRLSTDEIVYQHKKFKSDPNASGKQVKEKLSPTNVKIKERKVSVGLTEKKTPNKSFDSPQDIGKGSGKRELLWEDPTLPPGWRRIIKGKVHGTEFKPVVCIASPEGRKFYFKARLKEFLEKTNSHLSIDDFHFGLYEKSKNGEPNKVNTQTKKIVSKKIKKRKLEEESSQERKKMKMSNSFTMKDKKLFTSALKLQEVSQVKKNKTKGENVGKRNLLLVDSDLPPGWVRKVRIKKDVEGPEKYQVYIINPAGRKFRGKHSLLQYLRKTQSPLHIDQFYFGLYPKGDGARVTTQTDEAKKIEGTSADGEQPMLEDPTLPAGWRRSLKVRSTGESAGKMEVIIVSPDGRKHRSKGKLANYIQQKGLDINADDFDFSVFGKNSKRYTSPPAPSQPRQRSEAQTTRKRDSLLLPSDTSIPNLNLNHPSLADTTRMTREALMINYGMCTKRIFSLRKYQEFVPEMRCEVFILTHIRNALEEKLIIFTCHVSLSLKNGTRMAIYFSYISKDKYFLRDILPN